MFYNFFHNSRIYLIIATVAALAAVVAVSTATYRGAVALEERRLIERVETIASSIDSREITFLSGSSADAENPFYLSLKKRLGNIQAINKDVRFIYITGRKEGDIFFYLDSEPEDSPDYSPPGEVYTEASTIFHEVFDTGQPRFEGPLKDRWGEWVSAFIAVNHPATGERLAVLGLDVDALDYRKGILLAMATPILLIALLFMVFLAGYIKYRKEKDLLYLKAEFLSIASHDLRAPLIGVLWGIEALRKLGDKGRDPRMDEALGKIEYTLQFMKEGVQGILDSSRILRSGDDEGTPSGPANISEVIADVTRGLQFAARERDISVNIDVPLAYSKDILTLASKEKIRHIFSNLVSNAIKYSRPGGVVEIENTREDHKYIITIQDYGIGIPEEDQRKIFSPLFRARNAGKAQAGLSAQAGAGLGLYFTKRLVDECGGRIWFASEENKGTKFYVALPAVIPTINT